MSKVSSWSTTPGSNNSASPDGWPEGQSPSSVNDCAREMMAQLASWYTDLKGTITTGGTTTAYTLTTTQAHAALTDIGVFAFQINAANTGAATLAVDGLTAKSMRINGNALASGDLRTNEIVLAVYNPDTDVFDLFKSSSFTDADHTKLDGIEASADVTDTANVTAAGALMDSELTDIAAVKALNQGVATTDTPSFAQVTVDNITVNGAAITSDTGAISFGNENLTTTGTLAAGATTITGNSSVTGTLDVSGDVDVGDGTSAGVALAINGSATGNPILQLEQAGTIKAFLQYADSGDILSLVSDGEVRINPNNSAALILDTSGDATFAGDIDLSSGFLNVGPADTLTISAGVVTATKYYSSVDTESAASTDDLDTINGGSDGDLLIIRATNSGRTVVAKHGTGNLHLDGAADFTMDNSDDRLYLMSNGTNWIEISRSNNAT